MPRPTLFPRYLNLRTLRSTMGGRVKADKQGRVTVQIYFGKMAAQHLVRFRELASGRVEVQVLPLFEGPPPWMTKTPVAAKVEQEPLND